MSSEIIYVAGPYAHPYETIRGNREHLLTEAAATIAKHGHIVYSPITHSAPLERRGLTLSHVQWMTFNLPFIRMATRAVVVMLDGWEQSAGVQFEVKTFKELKTPWDLLAPEAVGDWAARLAEITKAG